MLIKTGKNTSASGESSIREPIEWNRMMTVVATVVVLFFFTRSAPFPASTFWELAFARDFEASFSGFTFPEALCLSIVDSNLSLIGLKAIYHILYFIICSLLAIGVFKNKEPVSGLVGLSLFAFTMQPFLNLRMLLTLIFVLGMLFITESKRMHGKIGFIFIPIMAAASGLGLNTLLIFSLIICHVLCNKEYNPSVILCALVGGLVFPEGFVASIGAGSVFSQNFMMDSDMQILYTLSGIYTLINLITMGKLTREDLPSLFFYAVSGFFALVNPTTVAVFIMMGLVMLIKLQSEQKPLSLNIQVVCLFVITAIVYLYLFINPFGIKLNPSVKNQLGKDLAPLMDGYIRQMPIERHNLGELAWKGIIRYDQEKIQEMYKKKDLILVRVGADEFKVVQPIGKEPEPGNKSDLLEF